ncbi:MAG: thiamine pyrophosphate-binding protein [Actinomycetota bacterium]|nr:pyruvate oxidase [Acidimicrobiia bacterium]MDQ3293014.1 thiamine pyrophosphate-binding protein [Actinomycetota bacterium]
MTTVAELLVDGLGTLGVETVWGVVGDALNPVTDAIRRDGRLRWIGVRHEEVGAFAASAQGQLSETIGVCMGTVGPGAIHLLNGLYDAAKSKAPVLAICGQVPLAELHSDHFQEVDNDLLFSDVAVFRATITVAAQLPRLLEQAVNAAYAAPGVAVLSLPGDVGDQDVPDARTPRFVTRQPVLTAEEATITDAVRLLDEADRVTILAGCGAVDDRDALLHLADRLSAPIVLTLKAKEGLERDNPYEVGQSGLIGNPASKVAFDTADLLLMLGTDFPYPDWLPRGTITIQVDRDGSHIGRRTPVELGIVADVGPTIAALVERAQPKSDRAHLDAARARYEEWTAEQHVLVDPASGTGIAARVKAKVRSTVENPDHRIRPEAVADAIDRLATSDAIFTTDTGMSTVWVSRLVHLGGTRRLIGSFNLGSMANAMPHALGAQALDPSRQVVACCGDGGLTMLLGDLLTAVAERLPIKLVVFDNQRLGMVKLEQEQAGLPEHDTHLTNPDLAAVARAMGLAAWRVEDPDELEPALRAAFAEPGPALVDVLTNPDELALPPATTARDAAGFAVAKLKEIVRDRRP